MSTHGNRPFGPLVGLGVTAALVLVVGYLGVWQWMVCRIEVPPGYSLLLRYKGPWPFGASGAAAAGDGELVKLDASGRPQRVGILEAMPGPGRHFYSPLEYERQVVPDVVIEPGKLGVVVSKVGKQLPAGTYLADEDGYRGIRRKVLTPGRYRINSYAYDVRPVDVDSCVEPATRTRRKAEDPTLIPPGYVGVVTNKTDNPTTGETQGIQKQVLQPGIYFLNPEEKRVDVISVGFNETSLSVETDEAATRARQTTAAEEARRAAAAPADSRGDRLGKYSGVDPVYVANKGIEFPSNDGFLIHLDFTAIWGIDPQQAPDIVRQFGTLKDVEQKVVLPQIGSICRMYGSKRGAVDLLVGDTREAFQNETSEELDRVFHGKNLSLLFGLTRHIYVPGEVRDPIQKAKIADELTKTREQEQLTAKAQAELTEAKAKVLLEVRRTTAETEKLVAEVEAAGEKKAREIEADTSKLQAEVDARTAAVEARSVTLLGEASAKKTELTRQAEAERFRLYVSALGGPDAYNRYVFAEGLPDDIKLGVFYAGPGTLWTDLKGFEQTMLGKIASESDRPAVKRTAAPTSETTPSPKR
ncbi:MAG: SPFH domain-containing protein [Isosphaeraceae bacterium]